MKIIITLYHFIYIKSRGVLLNLMLNFGFILHGVQRGEAYIYNIMEKILCAYPKFPDKIHTPATFAVRMRDGGSSIVGSTKQKRPQKRPLWFAEREFASVRGISSDS